MAMVPDKAAASDARTKKVFMPLLTWQPARSDVGSREMSHLGSEMARLDYLSLPNGLTKSMLVSSKSRTLRVASVARCDVTIAAIWASG